MDYFNLKAASFDASVDGVTNVKGAGIPTPVSTPKTNTPGSQTLVSTAFPPSSHSGSTVPDVPDVPDPDVTLVSADGVHFYVHQAVLLLQSANRFDALLPQPAPFSAALPALSLPEPSTVLNVVLHGLYGRSVQNYSPAFDDMLAAFDALKRYGISLAALVAPGRAIWTLVQYFAPQRPLDVYISAAKHDMYPMAALASGYLLDCRLSAITDDQARHMGALYLKRLATLHERRTEVLRALVLNPPSGHNVTTRCTYRSQEILKRAWSQALADLAVVASPGISTKIIRAALEAHETDLRCLDCLTNYKSHSKSLLMKWLMVDRVI